MTHNHTKTNPTPQHGADNRNQVGKRGLLFSFVTFMLFVGIIGLLLSLIACQPVSAKPIATNTNNRYYIDLSKTNSGQPSRNTLAFFVPVIGMDSQSLPVPTDTAPPAQLSATRGQTIISIANHLLTDYDGLTLQNKTAERQICGAVTICTESKTRHPIPIVLNQAYSVTFTQKQIGAIHHG